MVPLLTLLVLQVGLVWAGSARVEAPGVEVWSAPLAGFEPAGSCPTCEGPRAFAVLGGEAWILLSDRLVSAKGRSLALPSPGVDVAAGPEGLRVLCQEQLWLLRDGDLQAQPRRWSGTPLELSGDGAVLSTEGIDGQPLPEDRGSPWGADLTLREEGDHWVASWPGRPDAQVPGNQVVDLRLVGLLQDGAWVMALTDSRDGSAADGVRFLAARPGVLTELASGLPNGDLEIRPRRHYAVDPLDGRVYTLVAEGEALSLRRY